MGWVQGYAVYIGVEIAPWEVAILVVDMGQPIVPNGEFVELPCKNV